MSIMSELDMHRQTIEAVSQAMQEPGQSAEEQIERKLDWLIRELDEFCLMASNPETVDLIEGQRIAMGQVKTRVDLILSFLIARQPNSGLRLIKNG